MAFALVAEATPEGIHVTHQVPVCPMSQQPQIIEDTPELIVVLKPMGWSTHDAGDAGPNLTDWFTQKGIKDAAPVHRLDKGTSGIVLAGKGRENRATLSRLFSEGHVHKGVHGPGSWTHSQKRVIRRPLQDGRRGKPLPAVTRYRLI